MTVGSPEPLAGAAAFLGYPELVDLDGDGDLDFLTGTRGEGSSVSWCENLDGAGTFGPRQVIALDEEAGPFVNAADVDGDGDLDVLVASGQFASSIVDGSWISWIENLDGHAGVWTSHRLAQWPLVKVPTSVSAADLDGDGDLDVLFSQIDSGSERSAWLENLGANGFGAPQVIFESKQVGESAVAADMDGDGDLDVISMSDATSNGQCVLQRNIAGTGNFTGIQIVVAAGATSARTSDMDADGDLDLFTTTKKEVRQYVNNDGLGHFTWADTLVVLNSIYIVSLLCPVDLDGDGDDDLYVSSSDLGDPVWFENVDGLGDYSTMHEFDESVVVPAAFGDVDGDDDIDALGVSTGATVAWQPNDGAGHLGPISVLLHTGYAAHNVQAADIDGDGDIDVLAALRGDGPGWSIMWYENLDGGAETPPRTVVEADRTFTEVAAVDLDGDGDLDVLAGAHDNPPLLRLVAWYENLDGAGTFGPEHVISIGEPDIPLRVRAADVDGDLDRDVVVFGERGELTWYENTDGQATFGPKQLIEAKWPFPVLQNARLETGDLDGDGDLDLLTYVSGSAVPGNRRLAWYENLDGQGSFSAPHDFGALIATSMQLVDIDVDDDLDIILFGVTPDVQWLENTDGQAAFSDPQVLVDVLDAEVGVLGFADLDGDGDDDLYGSWRQGLDVRLVWLEHFDGTLSYAEPVDLSDGVGTTIEVLPCRFDSDEDVDLIVTETYQVVLFRNLGPWVDLESSLAGSWGPPHLWGDGTLDAGDPASFRLDHARPNAFSWLVMSLVEVSLPFKGGTLVPQPDLVLGGIPISPDGTLELDFVMPPGAGSGTTIYTQSWVVDPEAMFGVSASNGLLGVTP